MRSQLTNVRPYLKPVLVVVVLAALGIMTSGLMHRWFSARTRADHLEAGRAYAARGIEPRGYVPDVLRESSGVAVSRTQPGVLWSHNDSGDGPYLYAIDETGSLLATIRVDGAEARDWEDIAAGPCPANLPPAAAAPGAPTSGSCLYIADIGDNQRVRDALTVYVVAEPWIEAGARSHPDAVAARIRFRYPGERDDGEALAVLPSGDVTIVTKGRAGTIAFFSLSRDVVEHALELGETVIARHDGDTGIEPDPRIGRQVTGAAVSPDGTTLALRTYTEVFFYGRTPAGEAGGPWRDLARPCFLGEADPVGEGVDYLDGDTLLLTSEWGTGRPGPILRVRC